MDFKRKIGEKGRSVPKPSGCDLLRSRPGVRKGGIAMESCCDSSVEKCDIFDFMARYVGMTIIHPGGLQATQELAEGCLIDKKSRVLDLACGKGTSSIYLARKYGCQVVGLDIAEDLIDAGRELARKSGVEDKVSFVVGDALAVPFSDNEFDAVISQAMLVLIKDQKRAVAEAFRVTKKDGRCGWIELSWKKEPTPEFLDTVSTVICAYCMLNAHTFVSWKKLFEDTGLTNLKVIEHSMDFGGMGSMFGDEGIVNTIRIMWKYATDSKVRRRMNILNRNFQKYTDFFGYGTYIVKK